jgi:PAS domain S-box-containing protein
LNPDGSYLSVNRHFARMLGYQVEDFAATSLIKITHPDDQEKSVGLMRQMLKGEIHTFHLVKRYIHKMRHIVYAMLWTTLIRDSNGSPYCFVTVVQDVEMLRKEFAAIAM